MDGYQKNKCGNKCTHNQSFLEMHGSWILPPKESLYNTDRLLHVAKYGMDNV